MSLGEPFKDCFQGIILSDAATESNFIKSNGVFTAVSIHLNRLTGNRVCGRVA
jgi:hypothetical protein